MAGAAWVVEDMSVEDKKKKKNIQQKGKNRERRERKTGPRCEGGRRWGTRWRERGERRERAQRCSNKRSHVEKHSFSLTFSLSPSLSLHRTEQGRRWWWRGEMTFSFVLLRAPYYHLSRESPLFLHLSLSLPPSLSSFFFLLPHNGFK